jgi:hypothetical protein
MNDPQLSCVTRVTTPEDPQQLTDASEHCADSILIELHTDSNDRGVT